MKQIWKYFLIFLFMCAILSGIGLWTAGAFNKPETVEAKILEPVTKGRTLAFVVELPNGERNIVRVSDKIFAEYYDKETIQVTIYSPVIGEQYLKIKNVTEDSYI